MNAGTNALSSTKLPTRVIKPTHGWRAVDLREVWAYRDLLYVLAERDIKVRYKQTVLGAAWAILQPLASMILFTVVFGRFAKLPSDGIPYPVFVYAGLLPWTLFSATLSGAVTSLLDAQHLISKVYFPRIIVPVAAVGVALVDFLIASTLLVALMVIYEQPFSVHLLALPFIVVGLVLCAVGVGSILCAVTARFRDLRYVVTFGVQLWMYASPVVYPPSMFPDDARWLLFLNPVAGFIDGARSALFGRPFDTQALGLAFGISAVLFVIGLFVFARLERRVIDIL